MFQLEIFPHDSIAITVTTTVWIGVCVAAFFNMRLGWTLSGLVVPGYLVPLMMTRPLTAGVILFEAGLTYLLVRWLSDGPRLTSYWCSFFGRDRFFVIVVVSVLVRALLDGWLLPWFGQWLVEQWEFNFDYRNNLQSFGLIVVALIANYFWKPGLRRGIWPLLTCLGLTWAVVEFGLVGLTNFNVGNFHLLYEDVSTSLMASPKAYMIVITTAFLASWINLKYAWDFNGILIPALLGLLWHDPTKILVSIGECLVLFFLGSWLLNQSFFKRQTVEAGYKLVFFFTVCFLWRFLLCHLLPHFWPTLQLSDAFGFGYLLTTLMAVKAHDRHISIRMLKGIFQVSMLGAVAGSLIGFGFFIGPRFSFHWPTAVAEAAGPEAVGLVREDQPMLDLIRRDKILLYEKRIPDSFRAPLASELNQFRQLLRMLQATPPDNLARLNSLAQRFSRIHYRLSLVQDRYYYLRESGPEIYGWGLYVLDTQFDEGLCIEVPAPLDEWATVESGMCLFEHFPCRGLAIAGAPRKVNVGGEADVTRNSQTMFAVFHQELGREQPIQVRGLTNSARRKLESVLPVDATGLRAADGSMPSQLWVRGSLPPGLNLARLKQLVGSFQVCWNESPLENRLRDGTGQRFAELILNRNDRRALVARTLVPLEALDHKSIHLKPRRVPVHDWLVEIKSRILMQGTDQYRRATTAEMLYMDQEVVAPLVQALASIAPTALESERPSAVWEQSDLASRLAAINVTARVLGYEIQLIDDPLTDEQYAALVECDSESPRGWGTYVFRPGLAEPFIVEVLRPLFEGRSFEFGENLFHHPRASCLLVAGAHPRTNLDGSADFSDPRNRVNLLNLVRHVTLREMGDRPMLIAQARAIQAPVDADIVVATDDGATSTAELSPLKGVLVRSLQADQLSIAFVDGRLDTAGYELGILMQATAAQVSENKEIVSLWLSPSLRTRFREQSENHALAAQFEACGIPTLDASLANYLQWRSDTVGLATEPMPVELKSELEHYAAYFDIVTLFGVVEKFADWRFQRINDVGCGQSFLVVFSPEDQVVAVLNLTGALNHRQLEWSSFDRSTVQKFIRSRALWLEVRHP